MSLIKDIKIISTVKPEEPEFTYSLNLY
jgi:hypothetical protein